ncbi:hypothetical protein X773_33105 [Mesorhizobium sp. LSJC285A00]|nr:hypothetical protein X773_33105 [Mesorhizobium sp. LSJC285A00]
MLPDREQATSQAWLANHPSIVTVARDRGGGYGEAIAKASKLGAVLIAAIESNVPDLVIARTAIDDLSADDPIKGGRRTGRWLKGPKASLVGSFANGVEKDIAAVRNAVISSWSNGQTEGQITKLKLIKRQMYGRAKIDLLQARLVGAT